LQPFSWIRNKIKEEKMVNRRIGIFIWALVLFFGTSIHIRAEVVDRIVAVVNNDIITLSELNKAIEPYKAKLEAAQTTAEQKKQLLSKLQSDILKQLVDASLTKQEAAKFKIEVTEKEVDNAINNFKKANNLTDITLERGLAAEGLTMDDYRKRMKDQILQSLLVNQAVRSKIIVTDADIKAYYEENQDKFYGIRKYQLRNILTSTKGDMDRVVSRLEQGVDFQDLAKEYSIGSNASEGGDLGIFDIQSFSSEIKTALENIDKGEYTSVINTGGAFQIIYVEDVIKEGNQSLEEAEPKIREILFRSLGEKQFTDWLEKLKKNAHIKLML